MKTVAKKKSSGKRLTKMEREERLEARRKLVLSLYGKYAGIGPTSQDVIDERRWEVEQEELKYQEHLRLAGTGKKLK